MAYSKQNWGAKTVVTKTGLINMDDQIAQNATDISTEHDRITNIETGTTKVGKATNADEVPWSGVKNKPNLATQEELAKTDQELLELKMLGWTVPRECPIQNLVRDSGKSFWHRVDRVDMGDLNWSFNATMKAFYTTLSLLKKVGILNVYSSDFTTSQEAVSDATKDKVICGISDSSTVVVRDLDYITNPAGFINKYKGHYIYFEKYETHKYQIEGNEITAFGAVGDVWKPNKSYAVGEYCIWENALWKCLIKNNNLYPTHQNAGNYWSKTSVTTEISGLIGFAEINVGDVEIGTAGYASVSLTQFWTKPSNVKYTDIISVQMYAYGSSGGNPFYIGLPRNDNFDVYIVSARSITITNLRLRIIYKTL